MNTLVMAVSPHGNVASFITNIRESDTLVLATPLYHAGMVGALKVLLDRCMPLAIPFIEFRD